MRLTRTQQAAQRLAEINKNYEAKHYALHNRFNREFDAAMKRHGLSITRLMDVHSLPIEFHNDPDLVQAKADHLAGVAALEAEKLAHTATLPRPNLRYTRIMREVPKVARAN